MYNKPRRPYYNWSSEYMPQDASHQTAEHQVIDNTRFKNLWKQLRLRQKLAKIERENQAKSR